MLAAACSQSAINQITHVQTHKPKPSSAAGSSCFILPLCFGGRGGVWVLLEEPLCAVRSEVEEASSQKVRVGARRRGGGFLPSLTLLVLAFLLQGQRWERNHATSQGGELSLSALAVVLPGLEGRDWICREEERKRERTVSEQVNRGQRGRERKG